MLKRKIILLLFGCLGGVMGSALCAAFYLYSFEGSMSYEQKNNYFQAAGLIIAGGGLGAVVGVGLSLPNDVETLKLLMKEKDFQYVFDPEYLVRMGGLDDK